VLAALRASPAIELVGVIRSTRFDAVRRVRASGLRYALYLGCLMARRLDARALPVLDTSEVKGPEARAFLQRLAPDLLVSAFFNQKIDTRAAGGEHPSVAAPRVQGRRPGAHARLAGGDARRDGASPSAKFDSGT
jgi:methionyl-tRNA formyltransferase